MSPDIQYQNIYMSEEKEQKALRNTILQLTSNQDLRACKKFVNPTIHKPMLNCVKRYNKNDDRSIDLVRKDILEILQSQHALRNDDESKIYVSTDFLAFFISYKANVYTFPSVL